MQLFFHTRRTWTRLMSILISLVFMVHCDVEWITLDLIEQTHAAHASAEVMRGDAG